MSKKKNKSKIAIEVVDQENSTELNVQELDNESTEYPNIENSDEGEVMENNIEDINEDISEEENTMESTTDNVETRLMEIESRELQCIEMEEELAKIKKSVEEKEADLANRDEKLKLAEQNVKERDDVLKQKKQELDSKEKELAKLDKSLKKTKDDIERDRTKLQSEEKRISNANKELDKRKENAEENLNLSIEAKRIEKMDKLEKELQDKRNKALNNLEKTLLEERSAQRKDLDKLREENSKMISAETTEFEKKRKQALEEIQKEKENALKKIEQERILKLQEIQEKEEKIEQSLDSITKREEAISQRSEELDNKAKDLARRQRALDRKEESIDEAMEDLDEAIVKRKDELVLQMKEEIQRKNESVDNLREELNREKNDKENFNNFIVSYGDPRVIQQEIANLKEHISKLQDEAANMVPKDRYDELYNEHRDLKNLYDNLKQTFDDTINMNGRELEYETRFHNEEAMRKSRENTIVALRQELENKDAEILRLTAPIGRGGDRDKIIEAISSGVLIDETDLQGTGEEFEEKLEKLTELSWLDGIAKQCDDYGISFNKRLLYAFHTALKINEWSTITVLAGVSGTGKSELPRLYAAFGGLNFCCAAVQPNWDSQESMLGFFNSIDNKFEPEEVLRFLVQCSDKNSEYSKYMSIVLLDEMNLAHVEHYFANFLSKLESRRGKKRNNVPTIDVKLGAGVEPYKLELTRAILWTGTMNQDETTKSLSDKVLDRGIVINFPRPQNLLRRTKMNIINNIVKKNKVPKLTVAKWKAWTTHRILFSEEQLSEVDKYKSMVEEINGALEGVGRALGHRVWQSIEFYIMNYPKVMAAMNYGNQAGMVIDLTPEIKAAMKIAFEDQIVQKIMPKLRGIETKDKAGKKCLDKIKDILNKYEFESLQEDFDFARELGYGQFMWNTAKYLDKSEEFFNDQVKGDIEENIEDENNMEIKAAPLLE